MTSPVGAQRTTVAPELLGVVIANPAALGPKWTTVQWLALASANTPIAVFTPSDVVFDGTWRTRAFLFDRPHTVDQVVLGLTRRTARRAALPLAALTRVWWRRTPFDLAGESLARRLVALGVPVANHPDGMRALSDKTWLTTHSDIPQPATLVTSRRGDAHRWLDRFRHVVVKPARGSGGADVARVREAHTLDEAFTAARRGGRRVMVQEWIEADDERRLLVCDGHLIGGYRRQSTADFRHNLSRGAVAVSIELTRQDLDLVHRLAARLEHLGARFVAVDVLAGRVVEINAVNPGGTVWADALHGSRLASGVVDRLLQAPSFPGNESTTEVLDGHSPPAHQETSRGHVEPR